MARLLGAISRSNGQTPEAPLEPLEHRGSNPMPSRGIAYQPRVTTLRLHPEKQTRVLKERRIAACLGHRPRPTLFGVPSERTSSLGCASPHRPFRPVAVGTRVTPRPPHRSRRAELPHRAPTLSGGAIEAFFWIRVDDLRSWQPAVGVERHFAPRASPLVGKPLSNRV